MTNLRDLCNKIKLRLSPVFCTSFVLNKGFLFERDVPMPFIPLIEFGDGRVHTFLLRTVTLYLNFSLHPLDSHCFHSSLYENM